MCEPPDPSANSGTSTCTTCLGLGMIWRHLAKPRWPSRSRCPTSSNPIPADAVGRASSAIKTLPFGLPSARRRKPQSGFTNASTKSSGTTWVTSVKVPCPIRTARGGFFDPGCVHVDRCTQIHGTAQQRHSPASQRSPCSPLAVGGKKSAPCSKKTLKCDMHWSSHSKCSPPPTSTPSSPPGRNAVTSRREYFRSSWVWRSV